MRYLYAPAPLIALLVGLGTLACSSDQIDSDTGSGWSRPDTKMDAGEVDAPPSHEVPSDTGELDAPPRSKADALDGGRDAADALPRPNRCGSDDERLRDYFTNSFEADPAAMIPWGVDQEGDHAPPATFEATYEGIERIRQRAGSECHEKFDGLELDCATRRGLVLQSVDEPESERIEIWLALPLDRLDLPAEGTHVQVSYRKHADHGPPPREAHLSIRNTSTDEYIVLVRRAHSERIRLGWIPFTESGWPFAVAVAADRTDPHSAHCVVSDRCPRTFRFERLTLEGDQTKRVAPGEFVDVAAAGESYRFWHLVTRTRSREMRGWPELTCWDEWTPTASLAFARWRR